MKIAEIKNHINLHHSQTEESDIVASNAIKNHINLHHSQTVVTQDTSLC